MPAKKEWQSSKTAADANRETLKVKLMAEKGVPVREVLNKYDINGDGIFGVNEVMLIHEDLKEVNDTNKVFCWMASITFFCLFITLLVMYLLMLWGNDITKESVVSQEQTSDQTGLVKGPKTPIQQTKDGDIIQTKALESFGELCSFPTMTKETLDTIDYISFSGFSQAPPEKTYNFRMRVSSYTQHSCTKDLELSTQEGHRINVFRDPNIKPVLTRVTGCSGEVEMYTIDSDCKPDASYPALVKEEPEIVIAPEDVELTAAQQAMLKAVPADKQAEFESLMKQKNLKMATNRRLTAIRSHEFTAEHTRRLTQRHRTHRKLLQQDGEYRRRHLEETDHLPVDADRRLTSSHVKDCVMSGWVPHGTCMTKSCQACGEGTQPIRRFVIHKEQNGGIPCPSNVAGVQTCNIKDCAPDEKPQCDVCVADSAGSSLSGSMFPGYSEGAYTTESPYTDIAKQIITLGLSKPYTGNLNEQWCKIQHEYCYKYQSLWMFSSGAVSGGGSTEVADMLQPMPTDGTQFEVTEKQNEWKMGFFSSYEALEKKATVVQFYQSKDLAPAQKAEVERLCKCLDTTFGKSNGGVSLAIDPDEFKSQTVEVTSDGEMRRL